TRSDDTAAANDWLRSAWPWEARMQTEFLLRRTYDEARERNHIRQGQLAGWSGSLAQGGFGWVTPPVLNTATRIAVEICPARGMLRVIGYEMKAGCELPQP